MNLDDEDHCDDNFDFIHNQSIIFFFFELVKLCRLIQI